MEFFYSLALTVHLLVGAAVIGLVLIQHGKGADMGAAFGSGASGSLFGASGSANFMSRTTGVLATMFFITSLTLSYLATSRPKESGSVMDKLPEQSAPATTTSEPATAPTATTTPTAPATPADTSAAKDIPK
jgi:preprotein translocase subunit SecG